MELKLDFEKVKFQIREPFSDRFLPSSARAAWGPARVENRAMFMAKYCSKGAFLDAPPKFGCLWAWRSILWGKELLKKGLGWIVVNGVSIDPFEDQWIPTLENGMLGKVMGNLFSSFKVAHLINQEPR